jgi:hypothetical protein
MRGLFASRGVPGRLPKASGARRDELERVLVGNLLNLSLIAGVLAFGQLPACGVALFASHRRADIGVDAE